jgi:hypothetical protein
MKLISLNPRPYSSAIHFEFAKLGNSKNSEDLHQLADAHNINSGDASSKDNLAFNMVQFQQFRHVSDSCKHKGWSDTDSSIILRIIITTYDYLAYLFSYDTRHPSEFPLVWTHMLHKIFLRRDHRRVAQLVGLSCRRNSM